jgi:hypothetical protein
MFREDHGSPIFCIGVQEPDVYGGSRQPDLLHTSQEPDVQGGDHNSLVETNEHGVLLGWAPLRTLCARRGNVGGEMKALKDGG